MLTAADSPLGLSIWGWNNQEVVKVSICKPYNFVLKLEGLLHHHDSSYNFSPGYIPLVCNGILVRMLRLLSHSSLSFLSIHCSNSHPFHIFSILPICSLLHILHTPVSLTLHFPIPAVPQGRGSYQTGRAECVRNEAAERSGGEVCLPGWGQPHDEAHHQLSLQKQGGVFSVCVAVWLWPVFSYEALAKCDVTDHVTLPNYFLWSCDLIVTLCCPSHRSSSVSWSQMHLMHWIRFVSSLWLTSQL